MADTLASLLFNSIKAGDTVIHPSLLELLKRLGDGVYKVANNSLKVETIPLIVDGLSCSWEDCTNQLANTSWYTGHEAPSQALIDLVTAARDSTAYFAWNVTPHTAIIPGRHTSISSPYRFMSFADRYALGTSIWHDNPNLAADAAADPRVSGLAFMTEVNGYGTETLIRYKAWDGNTVQDYCVNALTPVNWAKVYIPSSTITTAMVDALHWSGAGIESALFTLADVVNYATGVTAGYKQATWKTSEQALVGMELVGSDVRLKIVSSRCAEPPLTVAAGPDAAD